MALCTADSGDHLGGVPVVGIPAVLVPPGEMDIILRMHISAKLGLPLDLFLFQLTEQSGAVLRPEPVIINMAVIGLKQELRGLLCPVHDLRHPLL